MEPDPDERSYPGMEVLDWASEPKRTVEDGGMPAASYSKFTENARKIISGENQCAMFCRGKRCKFCSWESWPSNKMAIDGLYSNWITKKILAMARPTTKAFKEKNVLQQFVTFNIKTVINLQVPGEHASCGDGNEPSGFSYNPQELMDKNIFFYNYGWPDFGVSSMINILNVVKVMQFSLSDGKVAVHCHAGLGRTGLLIACYLVFNNRMSATEAINYVRHRRPKSIQSSMQIQCISEFEQYLKPLRVIFANVAGKHEVSLYQFLERQKLMLHGYEARRLRYIPKVVYLCCERLLDLANCRQTLTVFHKSASTISLLSAVSEKVSSVSLLHEPTHPVIPLHSSHSLLDNDRDLISKSRSCENLFDKKVSESDIKHPGRTIYDNANSDDDDDNACIVFAAPKDRSSSRSKQDLATSSSCQPRQSNGAAEDNESYSGSSNCCGFRGKPQKNKVANKGSKISVHSQLSHDSAHHVVEALCAYEYSEHIRKKKRRLEDALNTSDDAWTELAKEVNPLILSGVLWDWLVQLKEPVLCVQDLNMMLITPDSPACALKKVQTHIKSLVQYLANVIVRLEPLHEKEERYLIEKLLSHLSHQVVRKDVLTHHKNEESWPEMKSKRAERLYMLFASLINSLRDDK